ncbi:YheC/YheD family protein [Ammoniphilus sp. CFH 90114]|uniref:YheC/YheD family protein n=1 Tax=Ammoniphilus sp. CFH 90114 TaxID=2493665 RepID=UPI00100DDA69|nr:YheC/YheD family protein [Ammoniphilus sp. CFH 90114]RXT14002.1 hypothetical protein EIZ39_07660 [Ammoniphilus sp. CFH 90114]
MSRSRGKWTKYKAMKGEEKLTSYLPETRLLTQGNLWDMMNIYGTVVIKPSLGSYGRGISKVSSTNDDQYEIIVEGNEKKILEGTEETNQYLKRYFRSKRLFIVQQWIPFATVKDSPFDLRVMVQRKRHSSQWAVTGIVAKIAIRGYFITNYAQKVIPLEQAIENSPLNSFPIAELHDEIQEVSLLAAKQLQRFYPKTRTFGLDVGLDAMGGIWIIEANHSPSISFFNKLEDKMMYETILRYKKG